MNMQIGMDEPSSTSIILNLSKFFYRYRHRSCPPITRMVPNSTKSVNISIFASTAKTSAATQANRSDQIHADGDTLISTIA